eukprot:COSAG02_NODE_601_length_19715_cov_445.701315_16_plen_451_part_00
MAMAMATAAAAAFSAGADASDGAAGRASSVFEALSEPAVPKCEEIDGDVFAIRIIDEDRLRTDAGRAATVRCEFHLPSDTSVDSLWAALLPYQIGTKRKVLSDREDPTYFYDTYHAPWREVKVPVGSLTRTEEFTVSGSSPYIIAASLRGPSFPPHAVDKKTGLVAFSQVVGHVPGGRPDVKPECFVRRTAPATVGSKRKLRGQPDPEWDKHTLNVDARRAAPPGGPSAATVVAGGRRDGSDATTTPEEETYSPGLPVLGNAASHRVAYLPPDGQSDTALQEELDRTAPAHRHSRQEEGPDGDRQPGDNTAPGVGASTKKRAVARGAQSGAVPVLLGNAASHRVAYLPPDGQSDTALQEELDREFVQCAEGARASASQRQDDSGGGRAAAPTSIPLRLAAVEEATVGQQSAKPFIVRVADLERIYGIPVVAEGPLPLRLTELEQLAGVRC